MSYRYILAAIKYIISPVGDMTYLPCGLVITIRAWLCTFVLGSVFVQKSLW